MCSFKQMPNKIARLNKKNSQLNKIQITVEILKHRSIKKTHKSFKLYLNLNLNHYITVSPKLDDHVFSSVQWVLFLPRLELTHISNAMQHQ